MTIEKGQIAYRLMTLELAQIADPEVRRVPAVLSSTTPVARFWGHEILRHDADAVNMGRAVRSLPLLWNHDSGQIIGRVHDIRLDGEVLRGELRLGRNAKAQEVWQDILDAVLTDVSIGYQIHDYRELKGETIEVTRWEPMEISLVSVPADSSAGLFRANPLSIKITDILDSTLEQALARAIEDSQSPARSSDSRAESTHVNEETLMTNPEAAGVQQTVPQPATNAPPVADIVGIRRDMDIIRREAEKNGGLAERKRVQEVHSIFDLDLVPDTAEYAALRARAVDEGWSELNTRRIVMEALAVASAPVADMRSVTDEGLHVNHEADLKTRKAQPTSVQAGDDSIDKFRAGVAEALIVRAAVDTSREAVMKARQGGFVGMRLSRLAEQYLELHGVKTRGWDDEKVARHALSRRASGMTTSDFANLLFDTANKALLKGWDEAPETWQNWVRIGQVPDFRQASRVGLSGFSSLAVVPEDGEITYGKFTDRKETIQAVSYAKKFRLTYQAIKNDDLAAFTQIPRGMGRAGQRVIGDMVYGILNNAGPTLNQDSIALFDTTTHKNYVAADTAPTTATLDTAFTAMAMQKDPNNAAALNISPRYLIVPKALENAARVQVASQYDPNAVNAAASKNFMVPNPFMNRLEIISDARLDGQTNGTKAWYLAADANVFDTIEVAFVDGIALPYLKEEEEWDTRGVEWVVGVDFGVAALDYRGLHKYKGGS